MAIERKTVLDQIEITHCGVVQVRFLKMLSDGDKVLWKEPHRATIEPGVTVDFVMEQVNAHLEEMGAARCDEFKTLREHVAVAHTPEKVAAYRAAAEARSRRLSYPEKAITGMLESAGSASCAWRNCHPSSFGIIRSRMMRSGLSRSALSSAEAPSYACAVLKPSRSRLYSTADTRSCSSSTTRITRLL